MFNEFENATIFRSAPFFGPNDRFLNRIARLAYRLPVLPVNFFSGSCLKPFKIYCTLDFIFFFFPSQIIMFVLSLQI